MGLRFAGWTPAGSGSSACRFDRAAGSISGFAAWSESSILGARRGSVLQNRLPIPQAIRPMQSLRPIMLHRRQRSRSDGLPARSRPSEWRLCVRQTMLPLCLARAFVRRSCRHFQWRFRRWRGSGDPMFCCHFAGPKR